ncbi:MAG: hypothetical protein ACK4FR_02730 [Tabrizicola sp.]
MIRWENADPERLHAQEQALLSLCDRMTILEQAFVAATDRTAAVRLRLDRVEIELKRSQSRLAQLERETEMLRHQSEPDR